MNVTLLGSVIEVSKVQPSKALFPMLVTLLGMSSIVAFPAPLINVALFLSYKLPPKLE